MCQWLDVEQEGSNWSKDPVANHQWLVDGLNAAVSILGQSRVGIYASKWGWVPMGDFADLTKFPLWWARYDGNPTLDNFEPVSDRHSDPPPPPLPQRHRRSLQPRCMSFSPCF